MKCDKKVYEVVLHPLDKGGYMIYVPDFDIVTQSDPDASAINEWLVSAIEMARDAIGLKGITLQDMGKSIPEPGQVQYTLDNDDIITYVDVDFVAYRAQNENKSVKKNCTIPYRLSVEGDRAGINYSKVLRDGLISILNPTTVSNHVFEHPTLRFIYNKFDNFFISSESELSIKFSKNGNDWALDNNHEYFIDSDAQSIDSMSISRGEMTIDKYVLHDWTFAMIFIRKIPPKLPIDTYDSALYVSRDFIDNMDVDALIEFRKDIILKYNDIATKIREILNKK